MESCFTRRPWMILRFRPHLITLSVFFNMQVLGIQKHPWKFKKYNKIQWIFANICFFLASSRFLLHQLTTLYRIEVSIYIAINLTIWCRDELGNFLFDIPPTQDAGHHRDYWVWGRSTVSPKKGEEITWCFFRWWIATWMATLRWWERKGKKLTIVDFRGIGSPTWSTRKNDCYSWYSKVHDHQYPRILARPWR